MPSQRLQAFAAVLCAAIQPLLFFRKILFAATKYIPYDYLGWHFPLASFVARSVRNGSFPWWDPTSYCGFPIHADIQAQLFYPVTWLALLASGLGSSPRSYYFYEWLDPLHMALGGVFAVFLLRRLRCPPPAALLGASAYQLGAFFASQAQHLGAISCAAWLPLALWAVIEIADRPNARWAGVLAVAVALTVLAGFPDAVFASLAATGLLGLVCVLFRTAPPKSFALTVAGMLLGLLICSIQLFPSVRLSHLSVASLRSEWYPVHAGLPFASLYSFVIPNYLRVFLGGTAAFTYPYNFTLLFTFCGHLPLFFLFLFPLARKSKYAPALAAVGLFSLLWMLGDKVYLSRLVCLFLPSPVKGGLYCVDGLMPFTLFAGILAALAMSAIGTRFPRAATVPALWILALASSGELLWLNSDKPFNSAPGSDRDLNNEQMFNGDRALVTQLSALADSAYPPLRSDSAIGENAMLRTASEIYLLPTANGDNPAMPLRYFRFREVFAKTTARERMKLLSSLDSPWIDALNVGTVQQSLYAAPLPEPQQSGKWERLTLPGIRLYRNRSPLPRFYLVHRIVLANGPADAARLIEAPGFAPSLQAVVEGIDAGWRASGSAAGGEVKVLRYSNNAVDLLVTAPGPLYLVSSETYFPGWRATVNGSPAALYPTNLAFRGLPVPAGTSRVAMRYTPEHIATDAAVSLVSCAAALFLVFRKPSLARRG